MIYYIMNNTTPCSPKSLAAVPLSRLPSFFSKAFCRSCRRKLTNESSRSCVKESRSLVFAMVYFIQLKISRSYDAIFRSCNVSRSEIFAMVDFNDFCWANLEELKKKISDFPNVAIFDLFHGLEQPGCSKVVFMDIIGDFMKILWGQPQIFMGQSIGWLTKHNGNILSI